MRQRGSGVTIFQAYDGGVCWLCTRIDLTCRARTLVVGFASNLPAPGRLSAFGILIACRANKSGGVAGITTFGSVR